VRPERSTDATGCFARKISGATADRAQLRKLLAAVSHGDVASSLWNACRATRPACSRSLENYNWPAQDFARSPSRSSTPRPDFAELVLAILGVAAKLERRRINDAVELRCQPERMAAFGKVMGRIATARPNEVAMRIPLA
jgi:hypothetical protein